MLFTASCGNRNQSKKGGLGGEISISGAFALYPLAVQWAEEFQQVHPGVHIDISAGGAGKGMTDALAGVADIGMVSREIYPQEAGRGAVGFAVAKDAVAATINASNPLAGEILARGLTADAARKIWLTGEYTTWGQVLGNGDTTPLHPYTRSDACGAAETWAQWMGIHQEDLGGTAVFGDPGVASAVQKDIYAIGLNNICYAYDNDTHLPNDGLLVLPIDVDGDGSVSPEEEFYGTKDLLVEAIAGGKYPSPPARDLYFVTKGIPENAAVKAFIEYVLTKGQKLNATAGYIRIPDEKSRFFLRMIRRGKTEDGKEAQTQEE